MISQQQQQKLQLKISAQQIQLLNFYLLNKQELEQRIKNELEENPFLDCNEQNMEQEPVANNDQQDCIDWEESSYEEEYSLDKIAHQSYMRSEQMPEKPIVYQADFREEAKQQLALLELEAEMSETANYIIDNLSDTGLLERSIDEIAEEISFKQQKYIDEHQIAMAVDIVKTLDPVGIGSINIRECLLAQLKKYPSAKAVHKQAIQLIEHYYEDLTKRRFEKIIQSMRLDEQQLKNVLVYIGRLNLYPVTNVTSSIEPKQSITPDFIITTEGNEVHVALHSSNADMVFVNHHLYEQYQQSCNARDKSGKQYLKSKLAAAEWLVSAIRQKEESMLRVMKSIVELQKKYFLTGDIMNLSPMVLRNVAEVCGYDLSTISRITSNRYAETSFGIILLKDLFSEGLSNKNGKVISNKVIQMLIKEAIIQEDKVHPYTDSQLVNLLVEKGYNIARRTVTKYRENLNIPIAQIRSMVV